MKPRFRNLVGGANLALTGAFFGALQWSAFLQLQTNLAATALVWLLATVAWLGGSLAGLVFPGRNREAVWLGAAIAAFYALRSIAAAHVFDLRWLPALLACVVVMGGYAGRFFRCRQDAPGGARRLFLVENTGFVAGMAFSMGALCWWSGPAFAALPGALAAACLLTAPRDRSASPPKAGPPDPR